VTKPRHNFGYLPGHDLQVPLLSGVETHTGFFDVPASAVAFKEHSNEVLKVQKVFTEKLKVWQAWKEKQGWYMKGKPTFLAPLPKPNSYREEVEEDVVRIYVLGKFYRKVPLHIRLEDAMQTRDDYQRYGLTPPTERLMENPLAPAKKQLVADENRNPLVLAEERRKALGLKREIEVRDGVAAGARVVPNRRTG
jgi:hypothetical protein